MDTELHIEPFYRRFECLFLLGLSFVGPFWQFPLVNIL